MTIEEFTKKLDDLQIPRHKCKCCGGDIYYDNTEITSGRNGVKIKGKSFQTTKVVNGVEYHLQVCQECLLKKFPTIKNLSRIFNVMSEQTQFAFSIPQDVFEESRNKYAMTKEHMIEKYGEEEGSKKWDDYCKQQALTNTFEYKQQKYGMTRKEFNEYNSSRAVTKNNLIKRHGEEKGLEMWENYLERQRETKSSEYILKTHGPEELKRILSNRHKGIEMQNDSVSRISQLFFNELDKLILPNHETFYKEKNCEYSIELPSNQSYFLDYYIRDLKICIEFNGDYWHANPNKYPAESVINYPKNQKICAMDIWKKDQKRYEILEQFYGIKTIVIWESDLKNGLTPEQFIKEHKELNIL